IKAALTSATLSATVTPYWFIQTLGHSKKRNPTHLEIIWEVASLGLVRDASRALTK
ncbi:hypothetical protein M404DRAFT_1004269, partial [Pisolithus tinctorius Marx 270]